MRLFQFSLAILSVCALAPAARAQYVDSPFSYNYLDINYAQTELEDAHAAMPTLKGFGGRLSFDSPEGVRVILSYDEMKGEAQVAGLGNVNFKRQDLEAGVGFVTNPSDSVDLVLDIKYLRGEIEQPGANSLGAAVLRNSTRSGYGVEFGMRSLLHEMVEFDLSGEFRDYFTSEIGAHTGLILMFTENFGLQARYTWFESQQKLVGGIRLAI